MIFQMKSGRSLVLCWKRKRLKPEDESVKIRLMFNGILWILKTGAPWRDLPAEFGPWNTVHKRFLEWARLEVWDDILRMLSIKAERDALIIDATFIRVHQHATGAKGGTSDRESDVQGAD